MVVICKRDRIIEDYSRERLHSFIKMFTINLDINADEFVDLIERGLADQMSTTELLNYISETAASLISTHPHYGNLASRVVVHLIHEQTDDKFSTKIEYLYNNTNYISKDIYELVLKYNKEIDDMIVYDRDIDLTYFGLRTLIKAYLFKDGDRIIERPQDILMRVAVEIHREDMVRVKETYDLMSKKYFIHATPTLFNSSTKRPQLSSCFLLNIESDSAVGIFKTLTDAASIAKCVGGLGINASHIRCRGSPLSTGGSSNGIIKMFKVFEAMTNFIAQGGNRRSSSASVFIEPWHPEIFDFLDLRKNTGKDEMRCRDIFTALWVPDLFMKRVDQDADWSLFCPNIAQGLNDVYGEEFERLYCKYEKDGLAWEVVKARTVWRHIVQSLIETGTPYILFKDACNKKSNQKNLGVIRCSNLCAEIIEYTDENEIAVCNLASLALPTFVKNADKYDSGINKVYSSGCFLDYDELRKVSGIVVRNLDIVIDRNWYPVKESSNSNLKHRPIGLGVQGLADVFAILRLPFESEEAQLVNKRIFETIYYGAVESSCELSKERGAYKSYNGSPMSKGMFQFDLWDVKPEMYDWSDMRERVKKYGIRNSLLTALMPTATTSQILGFNECFEPYTSNMYARRTLAGEFQMINKYLIDELIKSKLWGPEMKNMIIENDGSIQSISGIPSDIKKIYKTVWEMKMKNIVKMAADRGAYIDQSQSLNIFMDKPTMSRVSSMLFNGWELGLKTGLYYLRTQPKLSAIKITVDKEMLNKKAKRDSIDSSDNSTSNCSLDDPDCTMCNA